MCCVGCVGAFINSSEGLGDAGQSVRDAAGRDAALLPAEIYRN